WQDDPYNRVTYPWADMGVGPDLDLLAHYRQLGQLRRSLPALKKGDYKTIAVDDKKNFIAFTRSSPEQTVAVFLNRSEKPQTFELILPQGLSGGNPVVDVLTGESITA